MRDYITWAEYSKDAEFRKKKRADGSLMDPNRYINIKPEVIEEMVASIVKMVAEEDTLRRGVRDGTIMTEGDVKRFAVGSETEKVAAARVDAQESFLRSIAHLTEKQQELKIAGREARLALVNHCTKKIIKEYFDTESKLPALRRMLREAK